MENALIYKETFDMFFLILNFGSDENVEKYYTSNFMWKMQLSVCIPVLHFFSYVEMKLSY